MARNTISELMSQAKIAPIEPITKTISVTRSMRSLPNWSPRRPRSGVATDALSR